MIVQFQIITTCKIHYPHLVDVIEKTFGFKYDIYEAENLVNCSQFWLKVRKHKDVLKDGNYDKILTKIRNGECPPKNSLSIIMNELCERGQIPLGEYFI